MKRKLLFLLALIPLLIQGQGLEKNEIGALGGASYYMGDFNLGQQFHKPSVAIGVLFRHNFNKFYAIRIAGFHGHVQGDYSNTSYYLPNTQAPTKFSHQIVELNASIEIGFKPFGTKHTDAKSVSPYVTVGGGIGLINNNNVVFNIPFGIGIKYTPFNRWTIGAEWCLHKTLNDKIDNYTPYPDKKRLTIHNYDWVGIGGFFVSYRLVKKGAICPAYY